MKPTTLAAFASIMSATTAFFAYQATSEQPVISVMQQYLSAYTALLTETSAEGGGPNALSSEGYCRLSPAHKLQAQIVAGLLVMVVQSKHGYFYWHDQWDKFLDNVPGPLADSEAFTDAYADKGGRVWRIVKAEQRKVAGKTCPAENRK